MNVNGERPMRSAILILSGIVLIASCSLVESTDEGEKDSAPLADLSPKELLDLNQERWNLFGPSDYRFRFDLSGEIDPELTRPVWITVRNDTVASAAYVLAPEEQVPEHYMRSYQVIDSLFSQIRYAIEEDALEVIVARYDSELGFPYEIVIGFGAESMWMKVSNFIEVDR